MCNQQFTISTAPREFRRKFSRDEVNECPLRTWDGEISVVSSTEDAESALPELMAQPVLGFDTETRPAFRKGESYLPALIQFATNDKAWIFQLDLINNDAVLADLLQHPAPLKTGVSIADDIADLRKRSDFQPNGFLDLGTVAEQAGMQTRGLRNLSANLLGFRISKSAQTSNWARPDLTEKQIRYAATDAWVGYLLFQRMRELEILT
ncbi:MAG: 3'-5' exonuclease [Verrucomicrobiota bacterium]